MVFACTCIGVQLMYTIDNNRNCVQNRETQIHTFCNI